MSAVEVREGKNQGSRTGQVSRVADSRGRKALMREFKSNGIHGQRGSSGGKEPVGRLRINRLGRGNGIRR